MTMSAHHHPSSIPRPVLIGAGLLLAGAITLTLLAQASGVGRVGLPAAQPLASLELRFVDRRDGAVTVYAGRGEEVIAVLAPESNGFIRGVMRGLARSRKLAEVGAQTPFTLTRWNDGRLSLRDKATGNEVELTAFGPTNAAAFEAFLAHPGKTAAR